MDSIFQSLYEGIIPILMLALVNIALFFVKKRRIVIRFNIASNIILVVLFAWIIYVNRTYVYSDLQIYHMPFLREEALRLVYNLSNQFIALMTYVLINILLLYYKFVFNRNEKPAV
jgi:hypothetical protein